MLTDLPGRLSNLHLAQSKPLAPLFECVINSLQAISEGPVAVGRIDIHVRRATGLAGLEPNALTPVAGFSVVDNGVGFRRENYTSFETSDSTYKRAIGGKGIGRLLWLKAFREARVHSVYKEGGALHERSFVFRPTRAGIEDHRLAGAAPDAEVRTTVELVDFQAPYDSQCPQQASLIAERLIEHLLVVFLEPKGPKIVVHDDTAQEHIDVNSLYKERFSSGIEKMPLKVGGFDFTCHLARMYESEERRHRFFLCAHQREVTAENLQPHIPDLVRKLSDSKGQFVFLAYVTGEYLDTHVNQERTAIAFADPDNDSLFDEVARPALVDELVKAVNEKASPLLQAVRAEKREQIERYIAASAPEYRPLLKSKYAPAMQDIPPHLTNDRLDAELHKRAYKIEQSVRAEAARIQATKVDNPQDLEKLKAQYTHLIEEENELGKAKLAKYVIHRKTILELFERQLGLQGDGKYALEESIHEIICPLRSDSVDVPVEKLNLWIIDERLAFHHYLASDKALASAKAADIDDKQRPDLLIFNRPIAFVDSAPPFQSIVIVEFKRPMREDLEKDPVTQVYGYADAIAKGTALDRNGRTIPCKDVPIYGYIVCDITAPVKDACRRFGLVETSDGMGFFGFNQHFNTYVEVMSFSKVLENSKARNRIFFEQLGLPTTLGG